MASRRLVTRPVTRPAPVCPAHAAQSPTSRLHHLHNAGLKGGPSPLSSPVRPLVSSAASGTTRGGDMTGSAPAAGTSGGWAQAYLDSWNAHDAAAVTSFMADDVVYQDFALGKRFEGVAAVRAFIEGMQSNFSSDYRFEPGSFVGDGE